MNFDPNAAAADSDGVFGLPFQAADAALVLLPVPWEATVSYGGGTMEGPLAIREASKQVDLYDVDLGHFYERGIHMLPASAEIRASSEKARALAEKIIDVGGQTKGDASLVAHQQEVNALCDAMHAYVEHEVALWRTKGKIVGLVGGDHSTPYGCIKAIANTTKDLGILQIDAHMDLRASFEGFTHSHASIMYNTMETLPIKKLVQVGIRDFCEEEKKYAENNADRITVFYDQAMARERFAGATWDKQCRAIADALPSNVYISCDIDGFDPSLCPGTGTPVPGGLSFAQYTHLLRIIVESKKTIVGFDLNEVAPQNNDSEWNANVGARVLFKLCGWTLKSHPSS